MLADIIEKWQPSIQLHRREIVTITAATTAVIAAKAVYSLAKQFYGNGDCAVVPYTLPFVGSTREYRRDPQGFVEKWTKKLGPVYKVHIFGRMTTVVSGSYVREIFLNNDFDFQMGMRRKFDVRLLMDINEHVETTLARQILLNHLHRNMKNYVPRVVKHLKMAASGYLGEMPDGTKTLPHVYPLMQHMIANASASIFVGENLCKDEKLIDVFKNMTLDVGAEIQTDSLLLDWFSSISEFRQWWIGKASSTSRRYKRQLTEALRREIALREANKNVPGWERPEDILQDMLETVPVPRGMDAATLLTDWIIVFIFASIHTTSENSTVVMYRLLQHPELIPELLEEQKQVLKEEFGEEQANATQDVTSLFTFNVVRNLVKLDSLCRESMRMRNDFLVLPHRYTGTKPVTLSNGVVIKPGDDVIINQWYNHHSGDIQKDKAADHYSFQPFRYVGLDRQSTKIGEDFLLFGMGAHACPGRWFALQEVKTIVSVFIREFEISAKDGVHFPTGDINKLPYGELFLKRRT